MIDNATAVTITPALTFCVRNANGVVCAAITLVPQLFMEPIAPVRRCPMLTLATKLARVLFQHALHCFARTGLQEASFCLCCRCARDAATRGLTLHWARARTIPGIARGGASTPLAPNAHDAVNGMRHALGLALLVFRPIA